MRTGSVLLMVLLVVTTACSPRGWTARWYMFQAESALNKAHHLKDKKISFDERQPYYAKACHYYAKAYETGPEVFTLMRIEEAADACRKASLRDEEEIFWAFEEEYSKTHPQEVRYGDAGVGIVDMGS